MPHLWIRAEQRDNERRVGILPEGVQAMQAAGWQVTVEDSATRVVPTQDYQSTGCQIVPAGSWVEAPPDAIVLGLKELPDDGTPLRHRHIMFGHAFKGQPSGQTLLRRFRAGGGRLLDLEYLVDDAGRRVAAFGHWAGFAGAAVTLKCWAAQQQNTQVAPLSDYASADAMCVELAQTLGSDPRPTAIVIGALGRVGRGALDLFGRMDVAVTAWDQAETAHGGPFPEILDHDLFVNAILAHPGCPVFVPASAPSAPRRLRVIGDVACDPDSDFSPIRVYDRATTWAAPALRVHEDPPLDVMAIDNLPSLMPKEASEDFATQLLPTLLQLDSPDTGVWARAAQSFDAAMRDLKE